MSKGYFFSIYPRTNQIESSLVESIRLRVAVSDGVDIKPKIKFEATDLNSGVQHFNNKTGQNDSFTVSVVIQDSDVVPVKSIIGYSALEYSEKLKDYYYASPVYNYTGKTMPVIKVLDYFIRRGEPFYIYSRALGIDSKDLYFISENSSRKQSYEGITIWELTFTKYVPFKYATFKNKNAGVTKAIQNYKKTQAVAKVKAQKQKIAKMKSTAKYKLYHECKPKNLVYSKKKTYSKCVTYLQAILYRKKFYTGKVDGWYGPDTVKALKLYQKKHAKKYKLKVNGKVDKATFKALYTV